MTKRPKTLTRQSKSICFKCHPFYKVIISSFKLCSMSSAANNFLHILGGAVNAAQTALKTALVSSCPLYVELFMTIDGNKFDPYLAQYLTSLSIKILWTSPRCHLALRNRKKHVQHSG